MNYARALSGIAVTLIAVLAIPGAKDLFAQEQKEVVSLEQAIIRAQTGESTYSSLQQLMTLFLASHKYSEFVDELSQLGVKKSMMPVVYYFIGLTRYQQLKYLEAQQLWDEYFSQGNTYREQLTDSLQNAIAETSANDPVNLYSRLILWQFHKDQQDVFNEEALDDLMAASKEFANENNDPLPLKQVADTLLSYGEKAKARELYTRYVDKIASGNLKPEELVAIADDFFSQGNLPLAEPIYDLYIKKISSDTPKDELISRLFDIAKKFYYASGAKEKDLLYAEKIFQMIEDIGGDGAFNEELLYARAFNLEKAKEYLKAKNSYHQLLERFPRASRADEANYKIAMIDAYVARDIAAARKIFEKLIGEENVSFYALASLYQLGLLAQWEGNAEQAKEYYEQLIEKAHGEFRGLLAQVSLRLKEIEESKPLEYNLKTFLDASLKQGYEMFDMSKVEVEASGYLLKTGEKVTFTAGSYTPESGCMQVALQYLWSGDLGEASPGVEAVSFDTSYGSVGTKTVNVVVVAASGIIDRSFDMLDVQ